MCRRFDGSQTEAARVRLLSHTVGLRIEGSHQELALADSAGEYTVNVCLVVVCIRADKERLVMAMPARV
jgi:hypothetical protein